MNCDYNSASARKTQKFHNCISRNIGILFVLLPSRYYIAVENYLVRYKDKQIRKALEFKENSGFIYQGNTMDDLLMNIPKDNFKTFL